MSNVSVTALGTTISINKQATKTFPTYAKTVVQFHRWNSTPPQFIYLDLHGSEPSNNRRILAHMVVYGVKGYFPDVPSSVFDQIYMVNNGNMVMQTDLDLNGHRLMNNNLTYSINWAFDRESDYYENSGVTFTFDKLPFFLFLASCTIKDYFLYINVTDEKGVFDSHEIVFIAHHYDLTSGAPPSEISKLKITHPGGRNYSYGNLNINLPKVSYFTILIGKNYKPGDTHTISKGSIKMAKLGLSVTI